MAKGKGRERDFGIRSSLTFVTVSGRIAVFEANPIYLKLMKRHQAFLVLSIFYDILCLVSDFIFHMAFDEGRRTGTYL